MTRPKRLPPPSPAFYDRPLAVVRVPKGHRWLRLHRTRYAPMFFGASGDNRFDSPDGSFGMLYVARQINGSFVELFCRTREHRITESHLQQYRVAQFQASRGLKLIDLAGKGLVRMGLDARLGTGSYKLAQQYLIAPRRF